MPWIGNARDSIVAAKLAAKSKLPIAGDPVQNLIFDQDIRFLELEMVF